MDENGFYSIDRLVEFGLSMAIAKQMVSTMNEGMRNMYNPGSAASMTPVRPEMSQIVYVVLDGNSAGPFSEKEFMDLVKLRRVEKDTMAWMPGMREWKPIRELPNLLKIIALTPPPLSK